MHNALGEGGLVDHYITFSYATCFYGLRQKQTVIPELVLDGRSKVHLTNIVNGT